MKTKLIFVSLIIILPLILSVSAFADNGIEVVGSASPDTLNDGETTNIIMSITNNTNQMIYVTHISIDNIDYEVDFIVDKGITQVTDDLYTVNFGLNNSIGIPISISYDTNNDGNYLNDTTVYGSHVYMYRQSPPTAPPAPNVDFVVSADNVDINEGDFVNYTITTTNTSGTDIDNFTVVTNGSDIETFPMMSGTTRTINFSEQYFSDTIEEFGYYFYYSGGWYYEQIPDSTFNITIIPNSSATQQGASTPSPTPKSTATPNPTNTPSPNITPAPTNTTTPSPDVTTENTTSNNSNNNETSKPSDESMSTNNADIITNKNSMTPAMLTLIIVCTLLLISVVVLAFVIIKRK